MEAYELILAELVDGSAICADLEDSLAVDLDDPAANDEIYENLYPSLI